MGCVLIIKEKKLASFKKEFDFVIKETSLLW